MKALFKIRKKYSQVLFSTGYALLAAYILLNTSFLQLSIHNYVQQQNEIAAPTTVGSNAPTVYSAGQIHTLRLQKAVSNSAHSAVKINELFYLSVVTLTTLSFNDCVKLSDPSKAEHALLHNTFIHCYPSFLYQIPGRRAPPVV